MLRNYLVIALRTLRKQPGYSFINITGLGLGLAAAVLILLYVHDERGYDAFHEQGDRIYQLGLKGKIGGQFVQIANTPTPLGPTLVAEVPPVEAMARVIPGGRQLIEVGNEAFYEEELYWTDSTFFDLFTHAVVAGSPERALATPNTLVLTASKARAYFGDADPIGRTVRVDRDEDYTVGAVVADAPAGTHLPFELLASLNSVEEDQPAVWLANYLYTYVLLRPGAGPADVEARFERMIATHVAPEFEAMTGSSFADARAAGLEWDYFTQALPDLYLRFEGEGPIGPTGDERYVYLLAAVAALILLLACINFMNLATARSVGRAKEVGLRKVMGSHRGQLISQFLGESLLMATLALVVAAVLVVVALPLFNTLAGKALALHGPTLLLAGGLLFGTALVSGFLAGSYPAFFLSRFQPAVVLKGGATRGQSTGLRSGLVVVQFAVSVGLLVGTGVVFQQLQFLQNEQMGFAGEQVVLLPIESDEARQRFDSFRQALLQHPGVAEVSASDFVPGRVVNVNGFQVEGRSSSEGVIMTSARVSHEFARTLDLAVTHGRDFDRAFATDSAAVALINEAAARELGWTPEEALGKRVSEMDNRYLTIVGVTSDFHYESLHRAIRPLVLQVAPEAARRIAVRVRPDRLDETLAFLEQQWTAFEPGYPFEYVFLDDDFNRFYTQEQRLAQVFGTFTGLALVVACLGLFGLASFMAQQRTKEIGVRKVLGASVPSIVLLLSKEFTRLVLIAIVIALPLAYLLLDRWLQSFAYRTDLGVGVFLLAASAALGIAWLTVSYQSIKAAIIDPVRALRYE